MNAIVKIAATKRRSGILSAFPTGCRSSAITRTVMSRPSAMLPVAQIMTLSRLLSSHGVAMNPHAALNAGIDDAAVIPLVADDDDMLPGAKPVAPPLRSSRDCIKRG